MFTGNVTNFSSITSKQQCHTLREVSAEVFTDEDSDCDPDIVTYSSNWSVQFSEMSQHDGVEWSVVFQQNCNFIKHHHHTVTVTLVMMSLTQTENITAPLPPKSCPPPRVETGVVNRNVIWKRGRRVTSITGGGHPGTLLGLGNFDHTGKLNVGTRYFFYHWYHVPIVSTVYWRLWNWCWKTWTDHDSGQDTVPFRGNPDYLVPQHIWIKNI